jgi:hypothetical protein
MFVVRSGDKVEEANKTKTVHVFKEFIFLNFSQGSTSNVNTFLAALLPPLECPDKVVFGHIPHGTSHFVLNLSRGKVRPATYVVPSSAWEKGNTVVCQGYVGRAKRWGNPWMFFLARNCWTFWVLCTGALSQ